MVGDRNKWVNKLAVKPKSKQSSPTQCAAGAQREELSEFGQRDRRVLPTEGGASARLQV